MTDRENAVHAADILNDFINDLVGATNLLRYWDTRFRDGEFPLSTMVAVQRICLFHLVLTLNKFLEFYDRFLQIIPEEHRTTCKALRSRIKQKGIEEFRHKYVGHIWDEGEQRPLLHSEIKTRFDQITGEDIPGFLNWIDSSVVSTVDILREAFMSKYSISPSEFIHR